MFDREAANEPKYFGQAITLAQANNIQLAISNPSFEYWYLLHFIESDRGFQDSGEVEAELKRPGRLVGYEKHHDVFPLLRHRTTDAHDRAERLYGRCCRRDNDLFPNPITLVYKLVGGIIAMKPYSR